MADRIAPSFLVVLPPLICALVLSGVLSAGCYACTGPTLGVFLGGLALAGLITPALTSGEETGPARAAAAAGVFIPIAVVWFVVPIKTDTSFGQYLASTVVLAAWIVALAGIAAGLRVLRFSPAAATALVTFLAIAYLTWPVFAATWLVGTAGQKAVQFLVPTDPIFAVNSVLASTLGNWSEQAIIYRRATMNQDVLYTLPHSIWPAAALHGLLGITLGALTWKSQPRLPLVARPPATGPTPSHRPA